MHFQSEKEYSHVASFIDLRIRLENAFDDDHGQDDDTTRRGIDLIFIISLTFRRGKLGLVCASLMLPITSSLLKYRSESEAGPHPRAPPGRVPQPNGDHPDQGLKSS